MGLPHTPGWVRHIWQFLPTCHPCLPCDADVFMMHWTAVSTRNNTGSSRVIALIMYLPWKKSTLTHYKCLVIPDIQQLWQCYSMTSWRHFQKSSMYTEVGLLALGFHPGEGKNTNKGEKRGKICEETCIPLPDSFELKI